ncbi:tetratricopeptide repeat protein [Lysobacter cavernae]|uniref:Tetratricopeptide repeat protein n=1 Tax=Lysobacter cavernae TaxID=1685901 RepID=A0ABV7RPP8_9GAMM
MSTANAKTLRELFDAVCDLPPGQWRARVRELSSDPALIEEVLALLEAQTVSFNRALKPLGELMASLPEVELQPGDRLGAWQLVARLASGGMGTVFVAERADDLFRQRVAIKLLHVTVANLITQQRLAAERQILAELQHPNIARLFDGGTTPSGHPYLVMEYIDGLPLDRHCAQHRLDLPERLQLFLRVCRAVQAAHQRLVVHCDLKPSNILVRDNIAPVLLDFGIARVLDEAQSDEGHDFCTPAYASPEQLDRGHVGVASDVFSLGMVLTELLAGRRAERTMADRDRAVPPPSSLAGPECRWQANLPGDLDAIAGKACALAPEQRYPSVEALARDIERHVACKPVRARKPTLRYRTGRFLRRHWRESAAALALLSLAAGFVWRLDAQREQVEREAATAREVGDFLVAAFNAADPRMRGADGTQQPSARDVLDLGAAKIDAELADSPRVLARMRFVLGRAYRNLGQPQQAEALLAQAAEGFLDARIDQPEQAVQALCELALLRVEQMRASEALPVAQRALVLSRTLENAPALVADAYAALGRALQGTAAFDRARDALEQSLALRRTAFGPGSQEVAATLHWLGLLHRDQSDNLRAERYLRQALAIRRQYGARSVDVQLSLQGLAATLTALARYDEAIALRRENLELARALYGAHSNRTAAAHGELAGALANTGRYVKARDHYLQAMAIHARVSGEDSLDHAMTSNNLARLEEARGHYAEAMRLDRRSLTIRRLHLPADDRLVLRAQSNLGRVLARMGELAQARPLLEQALARWERHYGDDRRGLYAARMNCVDLWLREGRWDAAEAALRPLPAKDEPTLMLRRQSLLAELAQRRRVWGQARSQWQALVALSSGRNGIDPVSVAKWRVPYAEALAATGDAGLAQEQLRLAQPLLQRELTPGAEWLQRLDAVQRSLAGR